MRPVCRQTERLFCRAGRFHQPPSQPSNPRPLRHFHPGHQPKSLPQRARPYTSFRPTRPQRSGILPVTFLIGTAIGVGTVFVTNSSSVSTPGADADGAKHEAQPLVPSSETEPDMAPTMPPGRPGNLTPEQEAKLKEMWLAVLEVFGVNKDHSAALSGADSTPSSPSISSDSPNTSKEKKKSRMGWLGKHSGKETSNAAAEDDDKHGQTKEFKQALAQQSPESLRSAFWSMVKHDDPDALLLRFLRARKWDVHDALVMLVSTMHWRSQDMHVDDEIMYKGESGFLKASKTASGGEKKDAEDFMAILRKGLSFIHGADKDDRPITVVRVRTHKPNEQTDRAIEQYTVYVIETARMLLRSPVDTATIIFDMNGFSMSNMDYTPVKFMIKCFEANYPESLGSVLVYKSPWIFQGIWKIIKGWLDPVVASKVHFCSDDKELAAYIPKARIMRELGGDEDWKYEYVEPVEGEDAQMADRATRERIEGERKGLVEGYESQTMAWARGEADARAELKARLRENYWRLDPYVRARGLCDRIGMLGPGEKLDFYPSKDKVQRAAARAGTTSADDVD